MKKFSQYEVNDYLTDPSFKDWVRNGGTKDPASEWSSRLKDNPEQAEIAGQARLILLASNIEESELPAGFVDTIIENTLTEIAIPVNTRRIPKLWPLWAAASVLLLFVAGFWYRNTFATKEDRLAVVDSKRTASVKMKEQRNSSKEVIPLALPDGSTVLLHPGSSIRYPEVFNSPTREVHLSGQAFFEVTRDTHHPFYVYSNEMVTRVLGTSFLVSAFEERSSFTVTVKTGRVNVSAVAPAKGRNSAPAMDLTPNQQATFYRKDHSLVRSEFTEVPQNLPASESLYEFSDTPVREIFATLSRQYGVHIQFEEGILNDCALTTVLSEEPLFGKLKIICESIGPGTFYEVHKNTIVINSKGCNQ